MSLELYNPAYLQAKKIVRYPKAFMSQYTYFSIKKLELSGIRSMIFYEDDTTRYSTGVVPGRFLQPLRMSDFSCYPNPFISNLQIESNLKDKSYTLNLLTASGKLIQSVKNQDYMSVKNLQPGIYVVNVKTTRENLYKKVIKVAK
jgi:hypothetical protein